MAIAHGDPFCQTECAKLWHGVITHSEKAKASQAEVE